MAVTTAPAYADAAAVKNINSMYNASQAAQLAKLKSAYDQNMSNAQKAYNDINPAYQQKANDLGVQYERNRRNFNIQAAGNGLNTGVGSQAALAQNSAYQRDYGNLRVAQQNALNEAQRGINDLTTAYNTDVNAAQAQNDFQRNQALLSQYKTDYANKLTQAANLAKYGDFSGYKGIYSDAQIKAMKNNWVASNPDLAYRTGNITAAKYKSMTGNWPAGYTPPSSGGSTSTGSGPAAPPKVPTTGSKSEGNTQALAQAGRQAAIDKSLIANASTRGAAEKALNAAVSHGSITQQQYNAGIRSLH